MEGGLFSLEGQWPGRQISVARDVVEWIQQSLDVVAEVDSRSGGQSTPPAGKHDIYITGYDVA